MAAIDPVDTVDIIHVKDVYCPQCGASGRGKVDVYSTMLETDGSRKRYIRCLACQWRFLALSEPPPQVQRQ